MRVASTALMGTTALGDVVPRCGSLLFLIASCRHLLLEAMHLFLVAYWFLDVVFMRQKLLAARGVRSLLAVRPGGMCPVPVASECSVCFAMPLALRSVPVSGRGLTHSLRVSPTVSFRRGRLQSATAGVLRC